MPHLDPWIRNPDAELRANRAMRSENEPSSGSITIFSEHAVQPPPLPVHMSGHDLQTEFVKTYNGSNDFLGTWCLRLCLSRLNPDILKNPSWRRQWGEAMSARPHKRQ